MADKIKIKLRAHDVALLDATAKKIVETAKADGAKVSGPVPLPTHKATYTIKRATHKYGYAQEAFEKRTHRRLIQLEKASDKVIDSLQRMSASTGIEISIKL